MLGARKGQKEGALGSLIPYLILRQHVSEFQLLAVENFRHNQILALVFLSKEAALEWMQRACISYKSDK